MTLSLRGRLLIGVISLVVIGIVIFDLATYASLRSFLYGRVDSQLSSGRVIAVTVLGGREEGPGSTAAQFPTGTVIQEVTPDGTVLVTKVAAPPFSTAQPALPTLPRTLPNVGMDKASQPYDLAGTGSVSKFRVIDWPEDSFNGNFVVFAIPIDDVLSTLNQLLVQELLISAAVVGATAVLALLIVQIGLRPLRRMGAIAGTIAAGDLSRRVEPATPRSEIGRLGLALNAMLSQIEAAFAERKASEQRLRRFIADASHELRTPLTSVRGYSEMLRRGASESPSDAELARRRIEEESVRMSTLVDDMLLIARLDQGRPLETKPVDLQAIAQDAVDDARVVAPLREITLHASEPVVVNGDDPRLRQVMGNLMRNALVHTPTRTPIEVEVSTEDSVARISVTDHGPGLPDEDAHRIFEPFYRADPSRSRDSGGAGLGLSIVSAVVAAHGGRVQVRETSGGGATFEVELPLASSTSSNSN
jgi:two-component system OmpR family sensor kinase